MKNYLIAILATSLLAATGCDKKEEPAADAPEETAAAAEETAENAEGAAKTEAAEEAPAEEAKAEEVTVATVGKPAPDFELKDESGKTHKLSDHKGKIVVLEWTNPECPFVVRHYKAKTMQESVKEIGAEVVWYAVDSSNFVKPEDSAEWKKGENFGWPVLQDPAGAVGKQYGAKTTPHMYVIDAEGVLQYNGAIDNDPRGKMDDSERVNYVVEAVKAVAAGKDVENAETKPYGCSVKYGS